MSTVTTPPPAPGARAASAPQPEGWPRITVLLSGALALLGEYVLIVLTRDYGANRELVVQIGFAGTLLGIVLAILAIIYSYVQNLSQKQDAFNISSQIGSLQQVVRDAQVSNTSFSAELVRLEEIGHKLDRTIEIGEQHELSVRSIAGRLDVFQASISKMSPAPGIAEVGEETATRIAFSRATQLEVAMFKAFEIAFRRHILVGDIPKQILDVAATHRSATVHTSWHSGFLIGTLYSLLNLRLIEIDGTGVIVRLSERFSAALADRIASGNYQPAAEPLLSVASVLAAAGESVASSSQAQVVHPHEPPRV